MFISVLSFVIGIVSVQQLSSLPNDQWLAGIFLLAIVFAFYRYWRLMFFVMGILWAIGFASVRIADRLPEALQGQLIKIEGTVIGLPQRDKRRIRFDFEVSQAEQKLPKKIRLSWFFPKQIIKAGQRWQFTVKLKKPHGRMNPHGFDYEKWIFMQNIGATGYVKSKPQPQLLDAFSTPFDFNILRQKISDNLTDSIGQTKSIGLIKALTIGERNEVNNLQWDVFRKTGTVHLLAISGLHIGLIAGIAYFLVLQIALRLSASSPQIVASIFCIAIAIFYSALAGFSLPTQRALMMLTIVMTANSWQRNIKTSNTIMLAMLVVLIVDPLAVLSVGFWLSFLAVALIVYSLSGRLSKQVYWISALKIHWVTAIGLSPLLVFYFQQVSIISPVANLLTVPVISLIVVPLCLAAVVLMFVAPVFSKQLFLLIDQIIQWLWRVLSVLADLPYASINTPSVPFYTVPFALCGVLLLLAPKGLPARGLGMLLFLPLIFVGHSKLKDGEVMMTLLDVGQGLAAVIETRQHVLVFDTGAKYSDKYNMGDSVIIPFLQSKGIARVDTLVVSHGDNDHIGGAKSLLDAMNVTTLLTSAPETLYAFDPVICDASQSWVWDGVNFDIISPDQHFKGSDNDNSCVLKVASMQGSILLTGDIEKQAENWLVQHLAYKLESDILVAPHHGSKTSSTLSFLKKVKPELIIIPSGYLNRFSFPHSEVIERYEELNIKWMNTAYDGAISIELKKDSPQISSIRKERGRYWNY